MKANLGNPCLYLLPKIHKPNNPGRPIVSACSCPTESISAFLDGIFRPLVETLPSFLKDTTHALSTFLSTSLLPGRTYRLFLLDVCSLYTSIPHRDGLAALQFFLDQRPHPSIATTTLTRLAELVLTTNSFEFNGEYFDQISGVAMGTKMGPSYACLFMGHLEHLIFQSYLDPIPFMYRRYIDDGVGVTDMSESDLLQFIRFVGDFHPSIKFTSAISLTSVNFLDITVSIGVSSLLTTVYYKSTDSHNYLLYTSSHPLACRNSLPFSQLLRLRRLCQDDDDFRHRAQEMLDFFRRRLYPEEVLINALRRVLPISRHTALSPSTRPPCDRTKLVLTFHPHNAPAVRILLRELRIFREDPASSRIFSSPPLVAFRRDKNLRDLLVRSRLRPSGGHVGTVTCSRSRCYTCPYVFQATTISFPNTSFTIRQGFTCVSRNLIYAILCKRCGMAYIGETGLRLGDRFAQHLRDISNSAPTPVAVHFNGPCHHGRTDVSITGLVSCSSDDRSRLSLECRLIDRLGVVSPKGINVRLQHA
uniref:Reverse transcriptase domain-containing protein n=1 Tax=Arion vulgaris TaxID=1028688 RepID=A0A0B7BLE8_9EUPU